MHRFTGERGSDSRGRRDLTRQDYFPSSVSVSAQKSYRSARKGLVVTWLNAAEPVVTLLDRSLNPLVPGQEQASTDPDRRSPLAKLGERGAMHGSTAVGGRIAYGGTGKPGEGF